MCHPARLPTRGLAQSRGASLSPWAERQEWPRSFSVSPPSAPRARPWGPASRGSCAVSKPPPSPRAPAAGAPCPVGLGPCKSLEASVVLLWLPRAPGPSTTLGPAVGGRSRCSCSGGPVACPQPGPGWSRPCQRSLLGLSCTTGNPGQASLAPFSLGNRGRDLGASTA